MGVIKVEVHFEELVILHFVDEYVVSRHRLVHPLQGKVSVVSILYLGLLPVTEFKAACEPSQQHPLLIEPNGKLSTRPCWDPTLRTYQCLD